MGAIISLAALDAGSPWLGVAAAFCFAVAALARFQLHRQGVQTDRRDAGRCTRCGYDLTGNVSGVCPECGRSR